MMREEVIERQSTEYLKRLDKWYILRWKRRLELLNETTKDLWLLRRVLNDRDNRKD